MNKLVYLFFFRKKMCMNVCVLEKSSNFAAENKTLGIWCNGNTTDSGPVIPGSSPGIPTKSLLVYREGFFVFYFDAINPQQSYQIGSCQYFKGQFNYLDSKLKFSCTTF